ncbi:DUF927 domain-containing protein [Couchioplanes azureus]|uniref:DUF927 domain-containing protein n=2 Tax=Couchioplanes caeruleus TaxID=56438 RepID=UPI0036724744
MAQQRADGSSFERVTTALEAAGCAPRTRGTTHLDARCPAHDDTRPSLSVDWRDSADRGGLTLLCCQTGCPADAVVAALGMSAAELFDSWEPRPDFDGIAAAQPMQNSAKPAIRKPASPRPRRGWPKAGTLTAVYPYTRDGALVGEVGRFVDESGAKTFRWRTPVADRPGFWLFTKPDDVPLYRQDTIAAAVAAGEAVYVVEGEKDADTAAAAGVAAVTKPNGACKRGEEWRGEWTAALAGARVRVVADRDEAGYRHAAIVAAALTGTAAAVEVVRTPLDVEKADLAEHLAAGLALDALEPVPAELLPAVPAPTPQVAGGTVLPFPAQRRGGSGGGDSGSPQQTPAHPRYRIPMSQGAWRYSTGDDEDVFSRGVYRKVGREDADAGEVNGWAKVAELPYVLERLSRRDGDNRRTGLDYRLSMHPDGRDAVVCDGDEVKTGEWAPRLDVALSADDKIQKAAATAIRDAAQRFATAREITPRWVGGALELPPRDVGPKGYGETGEPATTGVPSGINPADLPGSPRDAWREIAAIAAANPKFALIIGAAMAGAYIAPLKRQSFVCLMAGESSKGKTTGLLAASAVHGDPEHLLQPWNTSPIGLTAELGELACLPAFRDELSAAGLTPAALETLLFRVTQGAQRTTGKRLGGAKRSAAWHGTLFTAGNHTILGRVANEGIAARVLEIAVPIVSSAAESERIEALVRTFYGWPMRWAMAAPPSLDDIAAALLRAEDALHLPGGGVARRLARHAALAVVGAERLETLTDADGLRDAAITGGRLVLDGLIAELLERGIRPGERLLSAVEQAITSRPAAFPTKNDYLTALSGVDGPRLPSQIEGFALEPAADGRQRVAVLTTHMDAIAASVGMDDALTGLRQLREEKVLETSGEADGRLQKQERIGKYKPRCYVFRLPGDAPQPEPEQPPTASEPPGPPAPKHPSIPGMEAEMQNSTNAEQGKQETNTNTAVAPAVPAARRPEASPPPAGAPAPAPAAAVLAPRAAHLVTPGAGPQTVLLPAESAGSLAGLLAWGEQMHLGWPDPSGLRKLRDDGQLWLLPAIATRLGLPEKAPTGGSTAGKELHARIAAELAEHGWKLGQRAFLAEKGETPHWWITAYRDGGIGLRLVLPHWIPGHKPSQDCPLLDDETGHQPDHAELAARLTAYIETTGTAWMVSNAVTGQNLIERTRTRASKRLVDPAAPPPPATDKTLAETDLYWQRPPTPIESGMTYVHAFDKNGMRLSAMGAVYVGLGAAEHTPGATFDPKIPGYWQIDPGTWDRDMLPNPFDPTSRGRTGPIWLTTPSLDQARRAGWWDGTVLDAWLWPAVDGLRATRPGVRYFEQAYELLRDARERLHPARGTDANLAAVDRALKLSYTAPIGKYGAKSTEGDRLYRPDWQHHIMGQARANLLRKLAAVASETGRYPLAVAIDCVLYASDNPDPAAVAAELGLGPAKDPGRLDPVRLAYFKHAGTAAMTDVAPLLGHRAPRLHKELMELFEKEVA